MALLSRLKTFFFIFLWVSLVANNSYLSFEKIDINSHLAEFSNINVTHHDNIDDEPHTHTHKHSEDGEEHEHSHAHTKVSQSEIKLLNRNVKIIAMISGSESKQGFIVKNFISNPHPSKIYRPPIFV